MLELFLIALAIAVVADVVYWYRKFYGKRT